MKSWIIGIIVIVALTALFFWYLSANKIRMEIKKVANTAEAQTQLPIFVDKFEDAGNTCYMYGTLSNGVGISCVKTYPK